MGFVHIRAADGSLVLIHTSQIAPPPRPAQALGSWDDVWARAAKEQEEPLNAQLIEPKP